MAHKAVLSFQGEDRIFDVLRMSFSLGRLTDVKGRPSSGLSGGEIHLEIESTADTSLLQKMSRLTTGREGSIKFYEAGSFAEVMKELKFRDAFLISYTESMDSSSPEPMSIKLVISAHELAMGDSWNHKNLWPGDIVAQ